MEDYVLVDSALDTLAFYIAQMIEWIQGYAANLLDAMSTYLVNTFQQIYDWIANLFTYFSELFAQIAVQLESVISQVIDGLAQAINAIWDKVLEASFAVLDAINAFVTDAWGKLQVLAESVMSSVASLAEAAYTYLANLATTLLNSVKGIADTLAQGIHDLIDGALLFVKETIEKLTNLINAAWEELVTGAESIIVTIGEKLGDLSGAFAEAAEDVVKSIGTIGEDMLGPLRDAIQDFVNAYLPSDDPATAQRAIAALEGIHTDPASMAAYKAWWESEWRDLAQSGPLRKTIVFFVFFLLSIGPTIMGISQTLSQPAMQEYAFQWPYQILTPADATSAWRRGLIPEGEAIGQIRRGGYSERQANQILALTSVVPGAQDMVSMWWRGIIDDERFDEGLKHQGIDEPWRSRIRAAAEIIPPTQDLIHMAVRDVWNPQAVEAGKLFEAFPSEVAEWTQKQGLSEEWAKLYWAAHWSLPSALHGFEMLHRKVINDGQLDTLLQALDLAPGWRGAMKAIAYHPFTRVDVRRMHRLGILSESEVTRAYMDLGYDEDKARALTEFTVRLNEPPPAEDDAELGQVSRTSILNFYADGILTRERAAQLLVDLGHTPEAAQLYLESVDLDQERGERKTEADLIIEQAEAGSITFDEAADKLRGLGLQTKEVERALTRLLRAQQRRTKIPSRADADAFYKLGLVNDTGYLDIVSRNGYAKKWADLYLQKARLTRSQN